jgi:hypothetical protein
MCHTEEPFSGKVPHLTVILHFGFGHHYLIESVLSSGSFGKTVPCIQSLYVLSHLVKNIVEYPLVPAVILSFKIYDTLQARPFATRIVIDFTYKLSTNAEKGSALGNSGVCSIVV